MRFDDRIACAFAARDESTHPDGSPTQRLGIQDVWLRQPALNPARIDAIESAAPASMGKSPS
jgi:hypothetical protein